MSRRPNKLVPDDFTPIPSQVSPAGVRAVEALVDVDAVGAGPAEDVTIGAVRDMPAAFARVTVPRSAVIGLDLTNTLPPT